MEREVYTWDSNDYKVDDKEWTQMRALEKDCRAKQPREKRTYGDEMDGLDNTSKCSIHQWNSKMKSES